MNEQELINQVYRKIEREKVLINGAKSMHQSSNNPQVKASLESQISQSERGIEYLQDRLKELQTRIMDAQNSDSNGRPTPPQHGATSSRAGPARNQGVTGPPTPPPKDPRARQTQDSGDYGDPGNGGYMNNLGGGNMMMPPRAPYGPSVPGAAMPKSRPNYTKLGKLGAFDMGLGFSDFCLDLIKYDTPYLGPRIQLMLSQLEFKLSVEKQYKDGVEKMVRLYQDEGDRKPKADAEARRVESNQKIQLLKQALKRYEDLHVDMESSTDAADGR